MSSLVDYFAQNRYKSKWSIGDRVFGYWNNIPFIGSVGTDSVVNEEIGPRVTISVDLPIIFKEKIHTVISVAPSEIRPLINF